MTGELYPSPTFICHSTGGPFSSQDCNKPVSVEVQLRCGPRNCGQSAPSNPMSQTIPASIFRRGIIGVSPCGHCLVLFTACSRPSKHCCYKIHFAEDYRDRPATLCLPRRICTHR